MSFANRWKHLRAYFQTERGQLWLKYLRYAVTAAVGGYLIYQLSAIGWDKVVAALPITPWFYVTVVAMYVVSPLVEAVIYRLLWWLRIRDSVPVVFRKRVLNNDVLGYSGDVYLYLWARKRLGLPEKRIFGTIKDNAIMSSFASWSAVVLLLCVLIYSGLLNLSEISAAVGNISQILAGAAVLVVIGVLAFYFRKRVFTLERKPLLGLFTGHVLRFLLLYVLQVIQWWVVLPTAPFSVWAKMLALQTLIRRFPFMPAADIVAMTAILQLVGYLDVQQDVIAAMIATRVALDKAANFGVFVLTSGIDAGLEETSESSEAARPAPEPPLDRDD